MKFRNAQAFGNSNTGMNDIGAGARREAIEMARISVFEGHSKSWRFRRYTYLAWLNDIAQHIHIIGGSAWQPRYHSLRTTGENWLIGTSMTRIIAVIRGLRVPWAGAWHQ
jgi:hypothetical protein